MYPTWAGRSSFDYDGSIPTGTAIRYGKSLNNSQTVTVTQWRELRKKFRNTDSVLGTSFDNPPNGSIGHWWIQTYKKTNIMSYVGAILLEEEYAVKNHDGTIRITR